MESRIYESIGKPYLPSLSTQGPQMAPIEVVAEFNAEVDAIRHSVTHAIRRRRGLTQMQLADEMRWSRANLTKVLQEQAAMPRESSSTFAEHTNCLALQQYRNMAHGLITKTVRQEQEDQALLVALQRDNAALEEEIEMLNKKYLRLLGAH